MALSINTMALHVKKLASGEGSSRSVSQRYLQKAIAQIYSTTNGTSYPFQNRYKISKSVF
ncbi:MAG: hypothetical protein HWQ41_21305 [Nostoc sp. NOS(2021)]|uniref:hypothetical protein n=1 Tax=Nostoc sp. NOS(2021) TaxID=2815407 RepID=UPI0025FA8944|nr:hypothetical protein [Nostoc sp. NOS(2021)]MBN3897709.1 hypothetical protein [Nostoc sp. NOS(2021)]